MFKRYKVKKRKEKPLQFKAKSVCRANLRPEENKTAHIVSMLRNSATSVKARGLQEAAALGEAGDREEQRALVQNTIKNITHKQKEVRALCYKALKGLASTSAARDVVKEYALPYLQIVKVCEDVEIRKDGLNLVDVIFKCCGHVEERLRSEIVSWLEADLGVVNRNAKWEKWARDISSKLCMAKQHNPQKSVKRIGHGEQIVLCHSFYIHQRERHSF